MTRWTEHFHDLLVHASVTVPVEGEVDKQRCRRAVSAYARRTGKVFITRCEPRAGGTQDIIITRLA